MNRIDLIINLIFTAICRTTQLVSGFLFLVSFALASAHASLNEADDALHNIELAFLCACVCLTTTATFHALCIARRNAR